MSMIEFQANGAPTVINYNVPEPTTYRGRNLISLPYPKTMFKPLKGSGEDYSSWKEKDVIAFLQALDSSGKRPKTYQNSIIKKGMNITPKDWRVIGTSENNPTPDSSKNKSSVDEMQVALVLSEIKKGNIPVIKKTVTNESYLDFIPNPINIPPSICIIETYKLSNFLGDYGAGKVISTFSLLPGERTKISIKTYKTSTEKRSETSSIFDSYTENTEDSFESMVQNENSDSQSKSNTVNYHVEAEAEAQWGVGSASVSAGVNGSVNSNRESFVKNMNSSVNKHANSASAKRDIQVNTSSETTTMQGEEQSIERNIENINIDRTLNFVLRQMNQEYISILHLVDIKIGFYNGYSETRMEVPLQEIDSLLEYCIIKAEDKLKIKEDILFSLGGIYDYNGNTHSDFVVKKTFVERTGEKSIRHFISKDKKSIEKDSNIQVDGLILACNKNVLRTDGIIVESLMGQSPAVSDLTLSDRMTSIELKKVSNQSLSLKNELFQLYIDSLKKGDNALTDKLLTYFEKTKPTENG